MRHGRKFCPCVSGREFCCWFNQGRTYLLCLGASRAATSATSGDSCGDVCAENVVHRGLFKKTLKSILKMNHMLSWIRAPVCPEGLDLAQAWLSAWPGQWCAKEVAGFAPAWAHTSCGVDEGHHFMERSKALSTLCSYMGTNLLLIPGP